MQKDLYTAPESAWDDGLLDAVDLMEAIPELEPKERKNYFAITCPRCQKHEAYIYKNGKGMGCNRKNNCGWKSSLWNYIQSRDGLSQEETLRKLAKYAGQILSERVYDFKAIESRKQKANLLEEAFSYCWSLLDGSEIMPYLAKRGYTSDDIAKMEIGYYPGRQRIIEYLTGKGYKPEDINVIEVFAGKWTDREDHKLVFPYRDRAGEIKTIYGRITREGEKENKKYLNFSTVEKDCLFNFGCSGEEIVIVEGYMDCLLAKARGIDNIVAVSSATISMSQLESLKKQLGRIKRITLALDNDLAGKEGTELTLDKLLDIGYNSLWIMEYPEGIKDLDELIAKRGVDAFEECLHVAQSAASWKARRILQKHDLTTERGRKEAFSECLISLSKLDNPIDKQSMFAMITENLGLSETEISEYYERTQDAKAQKSLASNLKTLLQKSIDRLTSGEVEPEQLGETLQEQSRSLLLDYQQIKGRPKLSLAERLQAQFDEEEKLADGDLLGYRLNTFKDIERRLDGIQAGLYILAAETNIGKTAFLCNLSLDILQSNPEVNVIYFSFDDSYKVISTRFRGILSGLPLNTLRHKMSKEEYEVKTKTNQTLLSWVTSGRLEIIDLAQINNMVELEIAIRQRAEKPLFVAIDGLYNVAIEKQKGGIREENIERANRLKAIVDTYELPLICTGEIRKKNTAQKEAGITIDDLMETGKFAYNANLVWLLYKPVEEESDNGNVQRLTLKYEKNKLSPFKGEQTIKFSRLYSKMEIVSLLPQDTLSKIREEAKRHSTTGKAR